MWETRLTLLSWSLTSSLIHVAAQVYVNSWGACGMWDWMCNLSTEVEFDQNPYQSGPENIFVSYGEA